MWREVDFNKFIRFLNSIFFKSNVVSDWYPGEYHIVLRGSSTSYDINYNLGAVQKTNFLSSEHHTDKDLKSLF